MSIFGTIMSKIFGHPAAAGASPAAAMPVSDAATVSGAATPDATPGATPGAPVDVEAVLSDMASKSGQSLNWQTSIVDLLKLLDLDSSMTARKTLATELHFTGDENDSASMNVWLHKQVMTQLAANGGKVPDSLRG